ncbi:hypothetical protein [Phaeobacter sp. J2-8]|uniref:hypothetical protein n=1 Tax=Phaeobacter sp. J2-8 TaxID=2931394 RepID=UPI001FD5F7C9|nr:hypothetical protein [Phaeobacter sp. J2-8]MCJ7871280.1 hypothetical protein [Phaeobacter sp. J2-8]
MLIYLNATVDQLTAENPAEIEDLFSDLLLASLNGTHFVIIDRRVCDWAKENLSCNNRERAQLDRLKELYTQRGSLPSIARSILEVEVGQLQLTEVTPHKYRIGHKPLLNGSYLEDARLLVEHIENDGDILRIILNETRRKHPIRAFRFSLLHGGGADIAACLRVEIPNRHIVVSVVDSDKVAPNDTPSATKRKLDREANNQTFVGMVCETPCKEAENYIPIATLRAHRQKICPEFISFETLESLITDQNVTGESDCVWLYFDLKKGIESEKLDAISDPSVVDWLRERYQLSDSQFSDIEIGGFGDAILRQFLNCGEAVKDFVSFMNTPYWKTHFANFFDLIYWYFASERKVRGV